MNNHLTLTRGIDYIGVGVGAAIVNPNHEILMALRGEQAKNESGKWEIPGGAVEFGETFEVALKREMLEEIGVEIEIGPLVQVCDHIIPDEKQHWVSPTYICRVLSGTVENKEPHKIDELRWCSLDEAAKLPLSIVTQEDILEFQRQPELLHFFD